MLAVHPLKPDTVLVGSGQHLWRSDDNGKTWREIAAEFVGPVKGIMFDEKEPNTYHLVLSDSLMTTWDEGNLWRRQDIQDVEMGEYVLTNTSGQPVAVSFSEGTVAAVQPDGKPNVASFEKDHPYGRAVCPDDASLLALETSRNLYISRDTGKTWERVEPLKYHPPYSAIAFAPQKHDLLVLGGITGRISVFDLQKGKKAAVKSNVTYDRIESIAVSPNAEFLWVGVSNSGMWILNKKLADLRKSED